MTAKDNGGEVPSSQFPVSQLHTSVLGRPVVLNHLLWPWRTDNAAALGYEAPEALVCDKKRRNEPMRRRMKGEEVITSEEVDFAEVQDEAGGSRRDEAEKLVH